MVDKPEWALWEAQLSDGTWWWFDARPIETTEGGGWRFLVDFKSASQERETNADWWHYSLGRIKEEAA